MKKVRVVVPDPALRELGGHHPASLQALVDGFGSNPDVLVDAYVHQDCEDGYIDALTNQSVLVNKHFVSDFYRGFYGHQSGVGAHAYIRRLAAEYVGVLSNYVRDDQSEVKVFWFYTLGWQHAEALRLAIKRFGLAGRENFQFIVFVMYSYQRLQASESQQVLNELYHRSGFGGLLEFSSVRLYASDLELSNEYSRLLEQEIKLHPCILLGKHSFHIDEQQVLQDKNKIIIYLGDAKINKGFLALPSLVSDLLAHKSLKDRVVVAQYSVSNDSLELAQVNEALEKIARENTRFELINSFIPHKQLCELMSKSSAILFNYSESVYRNQSSGVLWLAAFYGAAIYTFTNTWVNREAKRLGVICHLCTMNEVGSLLGSESAENSKCNLVRPEYFNSVFQDFGAWFLNELKMGVGNGY